MMNHFRSTTHRTPTENSEVEQPLIEQLQSMGWHHLPGDIDVPDLTERKSFRDVLIIDRLRDSLARINVDDAGQPWLDATRINEAVGRIERLGTPQLIEANQRATDLLLKGTSVEGDSERHGNREQTVRYIDFEHPERNDFLVVNQFRVDPPWSVGDKDFLIPDMVLFVNGIPLVVIECKSPQVTSPIGAAIDQLLRYSNQREWVEEPEGAERLFHYNQILAATSYYQACIGTVGATHEHFVEWKDTSPALISDVCAELGVDGLSSQQLLVAGVLRPEQLLDLIRNFTLFMQSESRTVKVVGRYQQYRAVQRAIERLQTGKTRRQHGDADQRGGIIWHTQGSGKSMTMVFLVRKMRTMPALRRYKVVVVTDRKNLEKQLSDTAGLTGETVRKARSAERLRGILSEDGPDLVFATIQKYQQRDDENSVIGQKPAGAETPRPGVPLEEAADDQSQFRSDRNASQGYVVASEELFPTLNEADEILVLVDEAHRTQASELHANLMRALPNCAKIGFTGTPIIVGDRKRTHEIFGDYIDRYTIKQSEHDGVTVPILYEGRTAEAIVSGGQSLDQRFEDMFRERTPDEIEAIKRKYGTTGHVLEAPKLIVAKADDMLRHYVEHVLPEGFKAQVVATSRLAAIRYQEAFVDAQRELIKELEHLEGDLAATPDNVLDTMDADTRFLVHAMQHLDTIRRLEFAAIISADHNDPRNWNEWTDSGRQTLRIERFKRPMHHEDPEKQDGLAFLTVKSMLLTGFDAPLAQVLYLDREIRGHELLQAIARVNRTAPGKTHGLVVDYYGVAAHLQEALAIYSSEDIQGALVSIRDELPRLSDRHQRVLAVFHDRGVASIRESDDCVFLLRDVKVRAEFIVKLKQFLETLNIVMPRPEALPYTQDAKILGFINRSAANLYRDSQLNIMGVGHKVQMLIDRHITAQGIEPKIAPVSILADNFNEVVESHESPRTKASEMEHAARHHISAKYREDPVYYSKLSQRLEDILQRFDQNWEQLVFHLAEFTKEVQTGREQDESGLDPQTELPFRGLLEEESETSWKDDPESTKRLSAHTVTLVGYIRQEIQIVDFWRNTAAQNNLRTWLVRYLDQHDIIPLERQQYVADKVVDLAKALHGKLVA